MKFKYFFLLAVSVAFLSTWGCDKELPDPNNNGNNNGNGQTTDTIYFTVEGIKMSNGVVKDTLHNSAKIVGDFSNVANNTNPIIEHGHVWSKTTNLPVLGNAEGSTQLGAKSSPGIFTSNLTGLTPNTVYYARAYVTTQQGTAYHPKFLQFKTKPNPTPVLGFDQFSITSDPNNSNSANPGETLTINVSIFNSGLIDAMGVTAQFVPNTGVQVLSSQPVSYGTIFAGAGISKTISIKIEPSAQWNSIIPITVNLKDNTNAQWTSNFNIEIKSPYIVSENLLPYYDFEDQSTFNIGQIKDQTLNVNGAVNGNLILSTNTPTGSGKSCSFPGTNDCFIFVPDDPFNDSQEFSYAFWVKTADSQGTIIDGDCGSNDPWNTSNFQQIGLFGTKLYCYGKESNYPITNVLLTNQWKHLVVTKNAQKQVKTYIDGSLFDTTTSYVGSSGTNDAVECPWMVIGGDRNNPSNWSIYQPFEGLLDNLRCYNRVLTNAEILQIFDAKQ